MSADDGSHVGDIPFDQIHHYGEGVGKSTSEEQFLSGLAGKVLMQQEEVVAEVKVGFAWIALFQGCSADMIYSRVGEGTHAITGVVNAATEVDFLHVGEKFRVESSEAIVEFGRHSQTSPRSPCHIHRVTIILSFIFLHDVEEPSSAVGIAQAIEIAPCRTGIFESALILVTQDLGLDCPHIGIILNKFQ